MTIFGGEDSDVDEDRSDSESSDGEGDKSDEESNSEEESEEDVRVVGSIDALRLNFTGNQVLPSRAASRESFLLGLLSSPLPR